MVEEAARNRTADEARKELIDLKNQADSTAYQAERSLQEMGDKVSADQRSSVEAKVKDLREAIQGDDQARIRRAMEALQQELQTISQAAYQQPGTGTQGGPQEPQSGAADDGEDVVEGEFREA